ncbi:DNA repair protein XRCC1 [Daktulosphaira vitifoliae]|uniref:DNA repair protein XRCC1 n=1 Tax=Daktulosphaira vitifoliae TaxID=58002 RepID=UPI0021A9E55F|nr:DNA repair protein XRCC1 [Daktulosphaira vitifoliae]
MGPIPVDRIISISSEDQNHKAENILNCKDSHKTWRCKSGEKNATIILQFLKPSIINSVDVGNDNSAFIEIFVGNSMSDDFQLLLATSSLMSLHDCKNNLNVNKVRFFGANQLTSLCKESWDRIKIVCSQPYIKLVNYGLSFVTFHSKDKPEKPPKESNLCKTIQLGSFTLKSDDDNGDDITLAGRLFAKRNEVKPIVKIPESPVSRLLSSAKKKINILDPQKCTTKNSSIENSKPIKKQTDISKQNLIVQSSTHDKVIKKAENSPNLISGIPKKRIKVSNNPLPSKKKFGKLLENVVFTMSGYENPYRSNVRDKASEMGAKYKTNWDLSCTHLICAFINTPKYKEAKVNGCRYIVKSEWIDKCHANKCRYPWRRFALDKLEQNKPESEDEIHELVDKEGDKNDEWETESLRQLPSTSQDGILDNIYDADTDIDSDSDIPIDILLDKSNIALPQLDNTFNNCSFYLSPCLNSLQKKECSRYIIALNGNISSMDESDYIVSTDSNKLQFKVPVVSPQWIWDCYDAKKKLPT